MGVHAQDVIAAITDLAYWMAKERVEDSLRELGKLRNMLIELVPVPEDVEEICNTMETLIKEYQFDDAWGYYRLLADVAVRYGADPPLTTYLPEETYERYEKASKITGETKSRYARKVLEGRRTPAEPPDGIRARERVERIARPVPKVDWEKVLEESEKPAEVDWEKTLEESEKPAKAEWEEILGGED